MAVPRAAAPRGRLRAAVRAGCRRLERPIRLGPCLRCATSSPSWTSCTTRAGPPTGTPSAPWSAHSEADVSQILFAVDPVQAVVDEAIAWGADLLVTHHPLYLSGVTSVAASTPKGRVVHDLISHGIALHTCHTNADSPPLGVSESMALALGLTDIRPLEADADATDTWVVFVPEDDVDAVAAAMHDAGAGAIGDYDRAMFQSSGTGSFRPLDGAIAGHRPGRRGRARRRDPPGDGRRPGCPGVGAGGDVGRAPVRGGRLLGDGLGPEAGRAGERSHRAAARADEPGRLRRRTSPTVSPPTAAPPGSPATSTGR